MIPMDVSTEDRRQNGSLGFGSNGTITPSQSSSSNSRRDSTGTVPKCDNVSKYPDKKQIEDKLNQIQEYLRITTSLMTSMKTTDDQHLEEVEKENIIKMISDLKDSEKKLVSMLVSCNGIHDEGLENVTDNICDVTSRKNEFEQLNRELDASKDSQLSLQSLQHKAENKMRNARLIQETLASRGNSSGNSTSNRRDKNLSDQEYDAALRELEEGTKRLNDLRLPGPNNVTNTQEKLIIDEIDALQNQIHVMHNSNEDRNQLIQMLDKRDAELRTQHLELQSKLTELQSKKLQVDQLVNQLQNIEEGEDDDVGCQVRKIVTMKDQLSKLKDMLALVQNTECLIQNGTQEEQAMAVATEIYNKAENLLNKDIEKGGCPSQSHHGEPNHLSLQFDNRVGSGSINDNRNKEVNNKNTRDNQMPICNGAKPKVSSISEKLALQAELKAKKRELEEIMGKHKASSSNLNHDVGNDSKSEFSCSNSLFDNGSGAWHPLLPVQHNRTGSSDRYSSDECTEGANDYSEIPPSMNQTLLLPCNFSTGNSNKHRGEHNTSFDFVQPQDYDRLSSLNRTPDRNTRGTSAGTTGFSRGPSVSNIEQVTKQNVQKQIELIRSVCDTMLSQQQTNNQPQQQQQQSNVHHLRNNLTPSPIYSEPRRAFASPMSHSMNALDVVNQPLIDNPWYNQNHIAANNADVTTYQHWLATNTLQTQAFMLNTLNQCCQMLWLQQRELAGLRSVVTTLQQDRFEGPQFDNGNSNNHLVGSTPIHPEHRVPSNQCSRQNNQNNTAVTAAAANKTNQVSAACSLPNLNQYNTTPINIDPAVAYSPANHSNLRLLPEHPVPANNINLNEGDHHQINNSLLHGVNSANVNQLPSQIWNGQALNNQVAPGNRANNYWDNFRSYSRQNLLSTKSNDGLQNLAACLVERNNFTDHRPPPPSSHHPYELPKSNSEQQSSHESTPQRSCVKPSIRYTNTNIAVVPPDVLNINQNVVGKNDAGLALPPSGRSQQHDSHSNNSFDTGLATHPTYPTNNASGFTVREHSNVEVDTGYRELPRNPQSRSKCRNEGRTDEADLRSKLFEELRENVYKEVVGLISANEARPHFLIQLFRDLQLISSDPLRLKALQSIQVLISQSLNSSQPEIVRQARNLQEIIDQGPPPPPPLGRFSLQSTVWSPTPAAISRNASALENIDMEQQSNNTFYEIVPFLNDHEHETLSHHLLATLKQIITESHSFKEVVTDTIFQKHFSNVLDDVLAVYVGKLLHDVKMPLLQNVRDLLHRELSFMNLIQGTCDSNINDLINSSALLNAAAAAAHGSLLDLQSHAVSNSDFADGDTIAGGVVQQIQNEDLAEADQSHVEDDDAEEEGAVGGFLEVPIEHDVTLANIVNKEESDLGSVIVDFPTSVESESQYQLGLDQVPTRLPTKSKSRSNTPNRDRSSSRQDMDPDHF